MSADTITIPCPSDDDKELAAHLGVLVEMGNHETVSRLLNQKVDPMFVDVSKTIRKKQEAMLKLVLDAKADPNQMIFGERPVDQAAKESNTTALQLLLAAKANPNGDYAIYHTVDADFTYRDPSDMLLIECSNDRYGTLNLLLNAKAEPDTSDWTGRTPLVTAVYNQDIEFVKELLEAKADPNKPCDNTSAHRPLTTALGMFLVVAAEICPSTINSPYVAAAKLLIAAKADLDETKNDLLQHELRNKKEVWNTTIQRLLNK